MRKEEVVAERAKDVDQHRTKDRGTIDRSFFVEKDVQRAFFGQAFADNCPIWTPPAGTRFVVPAGYQFYFASATSAFWTDNKDTGVHRPLIGWGFEPHRQVVTWLNRAQLMGMTPNGTGGWTVAWYEPGFDRSQGGTRSFINDTKADQVYHWYMNDDRNYYDDNAGTANITLIIRPG